MNIEIMRRNYEKTPKETLINILISSRETIQKRNKEIVRLKELCDKYEEEHKTTFEEWKKTINIIKEVREYIKEQHEKNYMIADYDIELYSKDLYNDILEILDKESK